MAMALVRSILVCKLHSMTSMNHVNCEVFLKVSNDLGILTIRDDVFFT